MNQHFSTEDLAEIQRMTVTQRGGPPVNNIDWSGILEELEFAANHYDLCCAPVRSGNRLTPKQTLDRLKTLDRKIADVLHELNDPRLIDWYFVGDDESIFRASLRRGKPLIETIKQYRVSELQGDIKQLEDFMHGRKIRRQSLQDCEELFFALLLKTGQKLFGPVIGDEGGPLITFIRFVAGKVLEKVPGPATLRSRLRRLEGLL
jgi:hypothetical protein